MNLQLEVGGMYRRRDGGVEKIVIYDSIKTFHYVSASGQRYLSDGLTSLLGKESPADLIEKILPAPSAEPAIKLTEPRKPQPGEWWELESTVPDPEWRIGYCIGRNPDGHLVWVDVDGDMGTGGADLCFMAAKPVRHLPDCTGFDYVIPEPEKPATKTVTLRRWLYFHEDEWRLTTWRERIGDHLNDYQPIPHDTMEVEVPA